MTTPKGRLIKSRVGFSSSKKAHGAFKSPFGNQSQSKVKRETSETLLEDILDLQKNLQSMSKDIEELQEQGLKEEELNEHIQKLHEYNEIKDMGQMLLGQIAIKKGVTTKELYEQFGLDLDD